MTLTWRCTFIFKTDSFCKVIFFCKLQIWPSQTPASSYNTQCTSFNTVAGHTEWRVVKAAERNRSLRPVPLGKNFKQLEHSPDNVFEHLFRAYSWLTSVIFRAITMNNLHKTIFCMACIKQSFIFCCLPLIWHYK